MCLWGNNTAVSIIGGADGPTSIFIAGKIGNSTVIYIVTGLCIIAQQRLECLPLSADINSSYRRLKRMRIRIAEEQDITEIESLYSQLFSAAAALQPDFISPHLRTELLLEKI